MKCKYCQAELEDGAAVCPVCGKELQPETPVEEAAPVEDGAEETVVANETQAEEVQPAAEPETKEGMKATPGKIALAVAAAVVVLALLVALVVSGVDGELFKGTGETIAPTSGVVETVPTETVPATCPPDGNPEDITCKGTYTVTDDEARAAADTVVATMGGKELTNGMLQVYYWEEVYRFLQENADYAVSIFGLDYTQPLDVQMCSVSEISATWQQYFLSCAIDSWRTYQVLAMEGETQGFELDAEMQAYLDSLPEEMEQIALSNGFATGDELVADLVGAGPDAADYAKYVSLSNKGYAYFSHIYENTNPTAEEVESYFVENEAVYAENGVTRDSGTFVDVRHILLTPQGGTTAEDGTVTYSDEEWEACRAAAQDILDEWLKGEATEDSFAILANANSTDPGSNTNGGLYTEVYEGQMVQPFNDWCFDAARQTGDTGLVKTDYGYHVMYFVRSQDVWYVYANYDLIAELVSNVVPSLLEKYPTEIDYSAIKIGYVELY